MRTTLKLVAAAAFVAACSSNDLNRTDPPPTPPIEGQSDFETPTQGNATRGGTEADAGAAPSAGAPTQDNAAGGGAAAPRVVEESDIWKIDGTTLYVLNRYRGLQIFDIANLADPRLVGRAPIYGYPKDMYVRAGRAYVIVSDYYGYWQEPVAADAAMPSSFHGSQVRVIDITDRTNPLVTGGIDVEGEAVDSRIVGDVLYLVSNRYGWWYREESDDNTTKTIVLSINVANPQNVFEVDEVEFPQSGWEHHISVTPDTIYVAAARWESNWNQLRTSIRYVDISDPQGDIRLRGEAFVDGRVQDRWSMDEWEGHLRVASGQSWGNGDVFLTTFDVRNPDNLLQAGRAVLHVNENLTAARFDGRYGYLVSYRNIDPLFTFDLQEPRRPQLLGELEMTGWLDFLVPMGDRIVALGHEDVTGPNGQRDISLAVSLIDVTPNAPPQLLSRVTVGENWGWVPGSRDDFAKVFKVLSNEGLVLFPFQSWSRNDWRYVGGVQLIDYSRDALTLRGLIKDCGWVERGIPLQNDKVITLSSEVLQTLDITNRDAPRLLKRLELARNVQEFAPLDQTHAVQLSGDWYMGNGTLSVTPLADPDSPSPTAQVQLPAPYGRLFMNGKLAYLASMRSDETTGTRTTDVQVIDFTTPTSPRLRGTVKLPEAVQPGYRYWSWGSGDEALQVTPTVLAFHRYRQYWGWGDCMGCGRPGGGAEVPRDDMHKIYLVDVSNPDAPRLASTVELPDVQWAWGLRASGNTLYLSDYRTVQRGDRWFNKYYLRRLDVTNPSAPVELAAVNIPGTFVNASADGRTVYTLENWYDGSGTQNRFHALSLVGDRAVLRSSAALDGWVNNVHIAGNYAYTTTQWYGEVARANGSRYWTSRTKLVTLNLSSVTSVHVAGAVDLPVDWAWLQKVQDGRAFLGAGPGVFTYTLAEPATPAFEAFYRTQGWAQDIVVSGNKGYMPSGYYGVQVLPLPVVVPH